MFSFFILYLWVNTVNVYKLLLLGVWLLISLMWLYVLRQSSPFITRVRP